MHHEKYVLVAILMPSRRMASITIDNSGDVKIAGNNSVRNEEITNKRFGESSHVANRVM